MKRSRDQGIIGHIVTTLGPLRKKGAHASAERALESVRKQWRFPPPSTAPIRKAATNLRKVLEPYGDEFHVGLKDHDRRTMPLPELRCVLAWIEDIEGGRPPQTFDQTKYLAARWAYLLVRQFSQKPPSTTFDGQVRDIGAILYEAVSGEEDVELKRQTDAACREWREVEKAVARVEALRGD